MCNSLATKAVKKGRSISVVVEKHTEKHVLVHQKAIRAIFLSTQIHEKLWSG